MFLDALQHVTGGVRRGLARRGIEEGLFDVGVGGQLFDHLVGELPLGLDRTFAGLLELFEQALHGLVVVLEQGYRIHDACTALGNRCYPGRQPGKRG